MKRFSSVGLVFLFLLALPLVIAQEFSESQSTETIGTRSSTINFFENFMSSIETQSIVTIDGKKLVCEGNYRKATVPITPSFYSTGSIKLSRSSTTPVFLKAEIIDAKTKSIVARDFVKVGSEVVISLTPTKAYNLYWYNCYEGSLPTDKTDVSITVLEYPREVPPNTLFHVKAKIKVNSISTQDCALSTTGKCNLLFELSPTSCAESSCVAQIGTEAKLQSALAISPTHSTCDNIKQFSSQNVYVMAGDTVDADFTITSYKTVSPYIYQIKTYKGCGASQFPSQSNTFSILVKQGAAIPTRTGDGTKVCPSVCVENWKLDSNACTYSACGSGCTTFDDVTIFKTEAECKAKIISGSGAGTGTGTGDGSPSGADFELSNLVRISNLDTWKASNPQLWFAQFKDGNTYRVTVKNTGDIGKGLQLEGFHVSVSNPFYSSAVSSLRSTVPIQSALGIEGITENSQTCKGEQSVNSYTLSILVPQESKEFFIFVPNPKKTDSKGLPIKLAGYDNYNSEGKYLLVVNAYESCTSGTTYDSIGGTINFKLDPTGTVEAGSSVGGTVGVEQTCDPTTLKNCPQKPAYKLDEIDSLTTTELLASSCEVDGECKGTNCVPMQKLINDGDLTEAKADDYANRLETTLTGTGLGAVGGAIACIALGTAAVTATAVAAPVIIPAGATLAA